MRKTYLSAALLTASFQITAGTCPQFQKTYQDCHSRSMIEAFQVSRVDVVDTMKAFEFIIKARYETKHLKFTTNGLPEEVNLPNEEGIPVPYVQTAHCVDDRIHLTIQDEDHFGKESYEFFPKAGNLTMKTYLNSVLINEVICKTTE